MPPKAAHKEQLCLRNAKSIPPRANGAKSHGPVTEEGRKKSSMNALKHGLTARTVLFSNDNHAEYDTLLESYIQSLQPIDPFEMDLVVEMVNTKWQQRRVQKFETELFDREMDEQKEKLDESYESYDETFEQTHAFRMLTHCPAMRMLHREASRLKRDHSRALNDLLRLRQVRELSLARNKKNEKRTESQDRTPISNRQPPLTVHQPLLTPQPFVPSTSRNGSDPPAEAS